MLYLSQGDFLFPRIQHLHALTAFGDFIVCKPCTADAQIVVAIFLDFPEVILRGNSRIKAHEHLPLRI